MESPRWNWPEDLPSSSQSQSQSQSQSSGCMPGTFESTEDVQKRLHANQTDGTPKVPQPRKKRKHWAPRTCRICLETVQPTFHVATEGVASMFQSEPKVTYESSDPEAGRLLCPCKCKGSSRYVHEGCLQSWRHADPSYGRRNFWQCPTCGFTYRLERLKWGRWVSSVFMQLTLTFSILFVVVFLLGFVADPIINAYLDPSDVLFSFVYPKSTGAKLARPVVSAEEDLSWTMHFLKGLASLGLLGFVKVLFAISPFQYWNLRSSGFIGGSNVRLGNNGRDRLASISWWIVIIGVGTFLWTIYKGVRNWARKALERAGERVQDVQGDDEDSYEYEDENEDKDEDDGGVFLNQEAGADPETKTDAEDTKQESNKSA